MGFSDADVERRSDSVERVVRFSQDNPVDLEGEKFQDDLMGVLQRQAVKVADHVVRRLVQVGDGEPAGLSQFRREMNRRGFNGDIDTWALNWLGLDWGIDLKIKPAAEADAERIYGGA